MGDRGDDGFQSRRVSIQSNQRFRERFEAVCNIDCCSAFFDKGFLFLSSRSVQPCCSFIGHEAPLSSGVDESREWFAVKFCVEDEK